MAFSKKVRREKIKINIRSKMSGTADKPRMSVYRSNKQISIQVINDVDGKTMISASSLNKEVIDFKGNKSEKAAKVGELVAKKALDAGITTVIFDRNGCLYHGRIKALAEAARKEGLKF